MTVKITSFEAENVKRIKAVQLEPSPNGLTIIGGKNGQGKTSILDAIAWTLGGSKFKPTEPHRSGSMNNPELKAVLSNGLIVERSGKNSDLKVIDPTGNKSGQRILDQFIDELSLNVPKFLNANAKEKANYLLQIIGIGDELKQLDREEQDLMTQRLVIGQETRRKESHAKELHEYNGVGTEEVSAMELILKQQDILRRNGENARKRSLVDDYKRQSNSLEHQISELESKLSELKNKQIQVLNDLEIASKDAIDLYDESTEEIENSLKQIDQINMKVRANREKKKAMEEASQLRLQYQTLTREIDLVRDKRIKLLNSAPLPLSELSVKDGEIQYKGHPWDGMSSSEQLKVATAICKALNPECGFVLLDKLEQMDTDTLNEFGQWLESQGLQAIATRVSTGDECSIIIEDGRVKGGNANDSTGSSENHSVWSTWSR